MISSFRNRVRVVTGLAIAAVLGIGFLVQGNTAYALDSSSGQGLRISPVLVELNGDPGKTYTVNLNILNVTTGDLVYRAYVNDFRAKDETGQPQIILDQSQPSTASLMRWISAIPSLTLKTKQSVVIPVKISIPANAEPGGHYGVIRFSGVAPSLQSNGVALSASVGTLILVRVSGRVTENLELADFYTIRNGHKGGFFETGPLKLIERLNNTGNVHLKPTGNIVIKNFYGRVEATLPVNKDSGNILPGSVRRFEQAFDKTWIFGRYSASMDIVYGTQGQVIQRSIVFWVVPWRLIGLIILAVLLLGALLRWLIKSYNARIIRKAQLTPPDKK